ncbi:MULTISPECIES: MXAN_5187 C-terminal domain-containing protein [Sandaracinus]|uniref:MXAN_5187 C-terminal domain-containing protein n=1 Tax=Sandaracinus TaxID=1055688 RepID=UPI0019D46AEA|nr:MULTISPECIES: MXAN_5187 C-terminal domain-containing protein [Sandaracinus]QRN75812.1 Hypothetical protein MSR10575_88990 [Sandaracinus sp.]UJR87338.1 Hypothetical protein I5071_1300 [Sandaracinus amylolyticus]
MMFSRSWIALLTAAFTTGFALCVVAVRTIDRGAERAVEQTLRGDAAHVREWIADDRAQLDAIESIASAPDIRALLREGVAQGSTLDRAARLRGAVELRNRQLDAAAGDVVVVIDAEQRILAQLGLPSGDLDARARQMLRDASTGRTGGDLWLIGDDVYRVTARAIIEGERHLGTIAHGERVDEALATLMATRLGEAGVTIVRGTRVIASASSGGTAARTQTAELEAVIGAAHTTAAPAAPIPVATSNGETALYQPLGTAPGSDVGCVVNRVVPRLASPLALFGRVSASEWLGALASMSGSVLVVFTVLAFALGRFLLWWESERQLAAFRESTRRLDSGECLQLDDAIFSGPLRLAARDVNAAIEKVRAERLAEMFGPVPPTTPAVAPTPSPAVRASVPDATSAVHATTPVRAPAAAPAVVANEASAAVIPPRTTVDSLRSTIPSIALLNDPEEESEIDPDEDEGYDATMIARPSADLLRASRDALVPPGADAALMNVFEEYVATKHRRGESTKGLTYERFVSVLERSRAQYVQSHGPRRVNFEVQVKNGKTVVTVVPAGN